MSTLKYKASERYGFGWADPRGALDSRMPDIEDTGFEDVSTDILKNLWLVSFQGPAVLSKDVEGDMLKVFQELHRRGFVERQFTKTFDNDDVSYYYVLKEKNGNR